MFQSPSGDSLFSDKKGSDNEQNEQEVFQSPSGDSLFSDDGGMPIQIERVYKEFQSPSGDSLFSDPSTGNGIHPQ